MTIQVKNTLDEVLEDYADFGFRLEEKADHILELYFKEKRIGTFSQLGALQEILWQACQEYLDKLNGKGELIED